MNTARRLMQVVIPVALVCSIASVSLAQNATPNEPHCFSVQVSLNDKSLEGPKAVVLRTRQGDNTILREGTCFRVPAALLKEEKLDILFTVPGSNVHFSAIPIDFFSCPWDVDLQDKKFRRGEPFPKHFRAKEACAVIFHVGEPERVFTETGCRSPAH